MPASNVNALYEKTRPHPLDPGVRLTGNAGDLSVIRLRKVRAVIWERGLPADIADDLPRMDTSRWTEGCGDLPMPDIKCFPDGMEIEEETPCPLLPHSILGDIATMADAFRKAAGLSVFETIMPGNFLKSWRFSKKPSLKDLIGRGCEKETGTLIPHQDGRKGAVYLTPFKLVTSYTLSPDQGMVWYPGMPLDDFESQISLSYKFRNASDPEGLMEEFDAAYKAQSMRPGDVIVFKTDMNGRHPEEILMHRSPLPREKTTRIALLLSNVMTSRSLS